MQPAPTLLPIFRSRGQARLLARLYLDSDHRWRSLTELAGLVGLAPSSVLREVDRLAGAGIVSTERVGNVRRVRANRESRFYPELRGLVVKAFGPPAVLGGELAGIADIEAAFIFGSWAHHQLHSATSDDPPRDIDMLVVGAPDPSAVYAACARAERQLGLEVAPMIVDHDIWAAATNPDAPAFLAAIRRGPLVAVEGADGPCDQTS